MSSIGETQRRGRRGAALVAALLILGGAQLITAPGAAAFGSRLYGRSRAARIDPATPTPSRAIDDWNGDGSSDFGVYDPTTGIWRLIFNLPGYPGPGWPTWGGTGLPVTGDWNGDGHTDFGIYVPTTHVWKLLLNKPGYPGYPWVTYGGPGLPVTGDWNGDGHTDFGIYNPATHVWKLLLNKPGYPAYTSPTFGGPGLPVTGDWNGDGHSDLGIYNPATGLWELVLNKTGFPGYPSPTFGGPGLPVTGDWNGDGHTDFGIYVPTTGVWKLILNLPTYPGYPFPTWGGPGLVPLTAPHVTPTVATTQPSSPVALSTSVAAGWSGSDPAGISHFDVRSRAEGWNATPGAWSVWLPATTATSAVYAGTYGHTYCFDARAQDNVANTSGWSSARCATVPLRSDQLSYSSGWAKVTHSDAFAGFGFHTTTHNATMTRTSIVAKQLSLVASRCPACGTLEVRWKGAVVKTVSLVNPTSVRKQVIQIAAFPTTQTGTVTVTVTSPNGRNVLIEGLAVYNS